MVKTLLSNHFPFYLNTALVLLFIYITEVFHRPFIILWVIYSLFPILDHIIPANTTNPTPEEAKVLKSQIKWKIPIYLVIAIEWVTLF